MVCCSATVRCLSAKRSNPKAKLEGLWLLRHAIACRYLAYSAYPFSVALGVRLTQIRFMGRRAVDATARDEA
jgi:hypothetical protein